MPASEPEIGHDEPTTNPASVPTYVGMTGSYGEPELSHLRQPDTYFELVQEFPPISIKPVYWRF